MSTRPGWTRAWQSVRREIEKLKAKKRITCDEVNRLTALVTGSLDYAAFADADFVVEAVFEKSRRQEAGLRRTGEVRSPPTRAGDQHLVAVGVGMAEDLQHPERVVGFHFFNPVAVMPLLEIVRAERTDDATLATAFAVAKPLQKGPILVARRDRVRRQPAAAALHG